MKRNDGINYEYNLSHQSVEGASFCNGRVAFIRSPLPITLVIKYKCMKSGNVPFEICRTTKVLNIQGQREKCILVNTIFHQFVFKAFVRSAELCGPKIR